MRMKKRTHSVLAVIRALAIAILIAPLLSCGILGIPDYELTVTVKDGVQGTPDSGQHSYKDLTVVDYAYTPVNYLHTVEVYYEGSLLSSSGTITMYTNSALEARLVDVRDTWTVQMFNAAGTFLISFDVTLSGNDILGGTFSDTRGLSGLWDGASNKITITYDNWESYILVGTLSSMSGIWTNGSTDVSGTWSATRTP
jgi:hypothetical protein